MLSLFASDKPAQRLNDLRNLLLFVDLNTRKMKIVDGFLHERTYLKDEVIFDEGEVGTEMYVIQAGTVDIFKRMKDGEPSFFAAIFWA